MGGVSPHRLKLTLSRNSGDVFVKDHDTLAGSNVTDGDVLSVVILSPLHGCLNRNGIEVPIDVMANKMDVTDALQEAFANRGLTIPVMA